MGQAKRKFSKRKQTTKNEMNELKCGICNSNIFTKFIDGHGDNRLFCRKCGNSFLEDTLVIYGQTNLQKFVEDFL